MKQEARLVPWGALTALVLLLEVAFVGLDLAFGGLGVVSTEERFNAQAAAHLACGHGEALLALRYRVFCGGCTAEAVAAAPLYRLLGPTVLAWKLVPSTLHLLAAVAGALLARRLAGPRAGLAWALLVVGAPAAWRQLALTGFGNHAEVMALVLGACALLAGGLESPRRGRRWLLLLLAGLAAGAGPAFAYIAAPAAVAVVLVGVAAWRRGGLWVGLGALIGIGPLLLTERLAPGALARAQVRWAGPQPAPPDELLRWLWSDFATGSLWPGFEAGGPTLVWWALVLLLGCAGLAGAWRQGGAGRALGLATVGLLLAMALRHDLWDDNPPVRGYDPFNLRYRVPLIASLALGSALATGLAPVRARRLVQVAVGALALVGFGLRVRGWVDPAAGAQVLDLGVGVVVPGDRPDATVPEGAPPQRLARLLGRPQDLEAARAFLAAHHDRLPECRADHLAEVGRRAALAWAAGHEDAAHDVLRALGSDPGARQALRLGLARGEAEAGLPPGAAAAALAP